MLGPTEFRGEEPHARQVKTLDTNAPTLSLPASIEDVPRCAGTGVEVFGGFHVMILGIQQMTCIPICHNTTCVYVCQDLKRGGLYN